MERWTVYLWTDEHGVSERGEPRYWRQTRVTAPSVREAARVAAAAWMRRVDRPHVYEYQAHVWSGTAPRDPDVGEYMDVCFELRPKVIVRKRSR